ncbi:MAG: hypothetical protein ACLPLR_13040 [Terriglobales bacterium]
MNNREWLGQLSNLTGLPYYQEHNIFGDKSGAVIGMRDGYIVATGLGKVDSGYVGIKMMLRYAKNPEPQLIKQALDAAKGKFKPAKTDETTALLMRTYSLAKPDAASVAEPLPGLVDALKTCALPISEKCEECGRDDPQMVLLNDVPSRYCPSCQAQLTQKLDAAATEYENLETNLPLGLLYGAVAALLGSLAWGGLAYLLDRIYLIAAIAIGVLVGKAVVMGTGKVTWTARALIGVLTAASVTFGDAIFYALAVMNKDHLAFLEALKTVLANFWNIEADSGSGLTSIAFGLIGAAIVMYSTRKPAFKARFVALGTPAPAVGGAGTK